MNAYYTHQAYVQKIVIESAPEQKGTVDYRLDARGHRVKRPWGPGDFFSLEVGFANREGKGEIVPQCAVIS